MFQSYTQRNLNMRRKITALLYLVSALLASGWFQDAALLHSEVLSVEKGCTTP